MESSEFDDVYPYTTTTNQNTTRIFQFSKIGEINCLIIEFLLEKSGATVADISIAIGKSSKYTSSYLSRNKDVLFYKVDRWGWSLTPTAIDYYYTTLHNTNTTQTQHIEQKHNTNTTQTQFLIDNSHLIKKEIGLTQHELTIVVLLLNQQIQNLNNGSTNQPRITFFCNPNDVFDELAETIKTTSTEARKAFASLKQNQICYLYMDKDHGFPTIHLYNGFLDRLDTINAGFKNDHDKT